MSNLIDRDEVEKIIDKEILKQEWSAHRAILKKAKKEVLSLPLQQQGESTGGWIPVSERLPNIPDSDYLVVVRNKNKEGGIYLFDVGNFTSDGVWAKGNTWEEVTHWQPLPPPPNN